MLNEINVALVDLNKLTDELRVAYNNYERSYKALEDGLTSLTQKGFTGDVAPVLMSTFNNKVKPNGMAMMEVVKRSIITMEAQTAKFNRTVDAMSDIHRQ